MSLVAKTKNVAVYEKLRQDIIKGRLKPGQRVVMGDLAKKVGSSETPSGRRSAGSKAKGM